MNMADKCGSCIAPLSREKQQVTFMHVFDTEGGNVVD